MKSTELESPIRVVALLSKPIILNVERFTSIYQQEWKTQVLLSENPKLSNPKQGITVYLASDGVHAVTLTYHQSPIPQEILMGALQFSNINDPLEVARYKNHTSFIDIHFVISFKETSSLDKVRFINRLLHIFAMIEETIGFINISAQLTRSKTDYLSMSKQADSVNAALFYLFVGVQVEVNSEFWMHTHGMEQFGLPDIECWYKDEKERSYYWEIIGEAALYMFDKGPILKVGHTFSLLDEETIFEIVEPKIIEGHEFGREGVIGIKKREGKKH